jgi:acetyl-CoA acetyltransferase
VDGSAALLLASPSYAKANDMKPRARVVATANQGDCPTLMLNAAVPAARRVLPRAGLTPDDIDLFEINEAFAVVAEKFIRDLKLVTLDKSTLRSPLTAPHLDRPMTADAADEPVLDRIRRILAPYRR